MLNDGACTSCKANHNLLSCDTPDRFTAAKAQMDRLFTGFHEFGHAAAGHGKSLMGVMFGDLTSSKDYGNKSESLSDSFATLMMLREFGTFGREYLKLNPHSDPSDAKHMTQRAVDATLQWVEQNPDRFKAMSPAQLLEVARDISSKHALTPAEVKATDEYLNKYSLVGGSTPEQVEARLAALQAGTAPAGYGPMAQEMDRYYQRFTADLKPMVQSMFNVLDDIKQCTAPSQIDTSSLTTPEDALTPEHQREQGQLQPPAARNNPRP